MHRLFAPLLVLVAGLLLAAGSVSLPDTYWQKPAATTATMPHDWSALERELKPEACGQCHVEQFEAWKHSLHAHAYSPGLTGQFPGMGHKKANDCLRCHAPLAEQQYPDGTTLRDSLAQQLAHPEGFDPAGDPEALQLPLRHAGVTCAACHVRGWHRFGPPQRQTGAVGQMSGPAHGGFFGAQDFQKSNFCATCHQFPQSMAVNGKLLENTVNEWRQSRFAHDGVQCQGCHMPDRRHEFRGIHDPEMVRKGLVFDVVASRDGAALTLTSTWIGHAFPTYVTPRVTIRAEALDRNGHVVASRQWPIGREVRFDNGWKEIADTRLLPGEARRYAIRKLPGEARRVRFTVDVEADHFYKGVYRRLLAGKLQPSARKLIEAAVQRTKAGDYRLFEKELQLPN